MITAFGPKRLKSLRDRYLPLVLIVAAFFYGTSCKAQTVPSGFPTLDSLSRYNNRYIQNSPVEAFHNLRIQTFNRGVIDWLRVIRTEAAGGGSGASLGIDSVRLLNDSVMQFRKDGLWVSLSVPFLYGVRNGLTKYGGVIGWGGTLVENTDIAQDGYPLTFHDGIFQHGTGDYESLVTAYSILESSSTGLNSDINNGSGTEVVINSTLSSNGQVNLQALNPTDSSTMRLSGDVGIEFNNTSGNFFVQNLIDSAQEHVVYYDPETGKFTYAIGGTGGGGGGGSGDRFAVAGEDDSATTDREFHLDGNGITFSEGIFRHGTGDFINQVSAYGISEFSSSGINLSRYDGTDFVGITGNVGGSPKVRLEIQGATSGSVLELTSPRLTLEGGSEGIFLYNLPDSAQEYTLHYNPTKSKVTYALNGGGSGGGGSSGLSLNTANGVSNRNDSTVILGGKPLDQQTTIDGGSSYTTTFTSSRASGNTLNGTNTSSGVGVQGSSSSGWGVSAISSTGTALNAQSGSLPADLYLTSSLTNTYGTSATLSHSTIGTIAAGFGTKLGFNLESSLSALPQAGAIGVQWTDPTHASRSSQMDFFTVDNAITKKALSILGSGQIQDTTYGYLKHEGTPASYAGWDASGNLIEIDPDNLGGGGGGMLTVTHDGTLTGSGTVGSPLGVSSSVALMSDLDAAQIAGGTTLTGVVNITSIGGVANGSYAGGTNNKPAWDQFNATAARGSTLFIPRGSWYFSSPPVTKTGLKYVIDGDTYFGTGNGFIVDGINISFTHNGYIYGTNQNGTINYGTQTNMGVYVRNAENCEVRINRVEGFKYGIQIGGYATGSTVAQGAQFNKVYWNYLRRNSVGLYVHPSGGNGSWSNGNWIYASKIVADTGVIFRPDVTDRPANNVNGNIIYGLGLENGGSPSIPMKLGIYMDFSTSNAFIGGRIEPAPITKKFYFTSSVNNTGLIGIGYIAWQWLGDIGNNTYIHGPIYDDVAGITVGDWAQGYRYSGTNPFYNGRIRIFGTTRSLSAMNNIPSNVDVQYTNETSISVTGSAYTVAPGIDFVRVNYAAGVSAITLPSAATNPDREIVIKNNNGSNQVSVPGQSNIAAGASARYKASSGNWYKIN